MTWVRPEVRISLSSRTLGPLRVYTTLMNTVSQAWKKKIAEGPEDWVVCPALPLPGWLPPGSSFLTECFSSPVNKRTPWT